MSLCIIPARSGSKRIPGKNIRDFHGRPIISYPIKAAIDSGCFDKVMVSTDSEEIANIAREYGAEVPFFRSPGNSNDSAGLAEVAREVITEYGKWGYAFCWFCCLLPTSVFITSDVIRKAKLTMEQKRCDSIISVHRYPHPIERSMKYLNGRLVMNHPENYTKRTQDFTMAFYDAGQFYWVDTKKFMTQDRFFCINTIGVECKDAVDIDTEGDWELAEIQYGRCNKA